jgi:hypothetical protein
MDINKIPDKQPDMEFDPSAPRNRFKIPETEAEKREKDIKFYTFEALGSQLIPVSEQIFEELASSMIGRVYAAKIQDGKVTELITPKNKPLSPEQRKHLMEEIERRFKN